MRDANAKTGEPTVQIQQNQLESRMSKYEDIFGESGVEKFFISENFVDIKFKSSEKIYRYEKDNVERKVSGLFDLICKAATLGTALNRCLNLYRKAKIVDNQ